MGRSSSSPVFAVAENYIIYIQLDLTRDIRYRNPLELASTIRAKVKGKDEQYYLFVDEIQMSDEVPNPYNPDGKKIIVRQDIRKRFYDDNGILNIGVVDFLLDETAL